MKFEYNPDADVLLIRLKRKKRAYGGMVENFILHYDKKGEAVEIEILNAKSAASKMVQTILDGKKAKTAFA